MQTTASSLFSNALMQYSDALHLSITTRFMDGARNVLCLHYQNDNAEIVFSRYARNY
jgi:hypothetical protein